MIDYGAKIVITGNAAKVLEQISKSAITLTITIDKGSKQISKSTNEINQSMKKLEETTTKTGGKMKSVFLGVASAARKIKTETDKIKSNFSGLGSKLAGLGLSIGAADVARRVYNAGTSEESTYARLKFALGSDKEAAAMMARLKAIGRNSTSPISQIYQNAGFLAPVFKGETDKYLKLFSEVVAGSGGDFGNIAFNFSQIKQAGRPELEDIKQFAYNNIPIFEELGKVLGVSVQQVRELQSEGKISFDHIAQAFENMTKKGGIYYGALDAQANTFRGKMQIIGNKMQELFVKAFDKARPYLDKFADKLEYIIDNFDEFIPTIKAVGIAIAAAFSVKILGSFAASLTNIIRLMRTINVLSQRRLGISGILGKAGLIGMAAAGVISLYNTAREQSDYNFMRKYTDVNLTTSVNNDPEFISKQLENKDFGKTYLEAMIEKLTEYNKKIEKDFESFSHSKRHADILAKTKAANNSLIEEMKGTLSMFDKNEDPDTGNNNSNWSAFDAINGINSDIASGSSGSGGRFAKGIVLNFNSPVVQIDSTHIDNKQYTAQQIGEIAAKELVNIMSQVAVQ